jgi:hypothetical protein
VLVAALRFRHLVVAFRADEVRSSATSMTLVFSTMFAGYPPKANYHLSPVQLFQIMSGWCQLLKSLGEVKLAAVPSWASANLTLAKLQPIAVESLYQLSRSVLISLSRLNET